MEEIWKDIPNYEGLYQISNLGRIKSLEKIFYRKPNKNTNLKFTKYKEKILSSFQKKGKYYTVAIYKNGKRTDMKIHRLVALAFLDKNDFKSMPDEKRELINFEKLQINHKDEDPSNNNVNNLEWCTFRYNCNYGTRIKRINETKKRKAVVNNDL